MKTVTFSITVEIAEDQEVGTAELNDVLSQMEDITAKRSWDLYDSEVIEEA